MISVWKARQMAIYEETSQTVGSAASIASNYLRPSMFCPTDKNLLLRNDSDKPLYQCSDCSGVFVSVSDAATDDGALLDAPLSTLRYPKDGSVLRISEIDGMPIHLCSKCSSAWIDGDSQERLFSKLPHWFGKPRRETTTDSVAGAIAIEVIISILMG